MYDSISSDLIMFELKNIMAQTNDERKKITSANYAKWNEAGAICDVQFSQTQIAFNARAGSFCCQRGLLCADPGPSSLKEEIVP